MKIRRYWFKFKSHHPKYYIYVRRYALIWLTLILFDAHRYGCWLTGDKSYWYPMSYILVPISLLPFLPGIIAAWVPWAERNGKQYTYKFILLWIPGIILFVMLHAWMSGGYIFNPHWTDKTFFGLLRADKSTIGAVVVIAITTLGIWCALREGINPFKL